MDLLLPELLLMASFTFLLAFFLARLISVAATTPTPPSSQRDRPLLYAAAVNRAAAVGTGPWEAGEGEVGEQEKEQEQQEERDSALPSLILDSGVYDHRGLDDGGRWREVEIVGAMEGVHTGLPGLSSDEATGVLQPEAEWQESGEQEQEEKRIVRDVHVISVHEAQEEDKRKSTPHADDDDVGAEEENKPEPTPTEHDDDDGDAVRTATSMTIAIDHPREGLRSEEEARVSDSPPRAESVIDSTAVQVVQVTAVQPKESGSSSSDDYDDDWEGIEASDLRKLFATAASFVASPAGVDAVSKLPTEVQLQLHGLHKVATEGPCFEAQPMPLKIAARAKWHAWQKLGDMNPEVAMERYISMLSEKVPGWMVDKPKVKITECEASDSSEQHQPMIQTERNPDFN